MKKILVTGGAGFVGTNLIKRLIKEGHDVSSIDNYSTGLKSNHIEGCNYIKANIYNFDWRNEIYDVIFHMAAVARIQPSFKNPKEYFYVNANGTLNIVEYCSKNNIPLIYAGSSSHHSGKFKNPYTFSKDIGEEIIELYQKHFNLQSSIVRFYNVYGPGEERKGKMASVAYQAWKLGSFRIFPKKATRDFVYVKDIVSATIYPLFNNVEPGVYDVGCGESRLFEDVLDLMEIPYEYTSNYEIPDWYQFYTKSDKSKWIPGWKPEYNLESGIKDYKEYLK